MSDSGDVAQSGVESVGTHAKGIGSSMADLESISRSLNSACMCVTLDRNALLRAIALEIDDPAQLPAFLETRPHLFSGAPVFVSAAELAEMIGVAQAIEDATRLPKYREAVLEWAPDIARNEFGPHGVFMSYDFHLGAAGAKLIEVNTNAGGAFLNAMLAKAQRACCTAAEAVAAKPFAENFEDAVVRMIEVEWRSQRGTGRPKTIAIVDDDPEGQYLYPEFLIAQRMLQRNGFQVLIIDAGQLIHEAGCLSFEGQVIDLVYNRLVDFPLHESDHAALRGAYLDQSVVVTPTPRNHALFADKRNLVLLSDPARMAAFGLGAEDVARLSTLPRTIHVSADASEELWKKRNGLFFKPASGHGGKAVYRGDKITKRVWGEILTGDYVAQDYAPPSERTIVIDGTQHSRKLDVRLYTYDGGVLLAAARLYQGQTTNFRTPGGGFAPVFIV